MRIKLLISRAGADFSQGVGDVITVSDAEAARMIEAGQALPEIASKKETAVKPSAAQKAVKE